VSNCGWIKLFRKSLDSGLLKNHKLWVFWCYCLMKANHKKDFKCVVGYQEVILQPGEFVFGLKVAAEETNISIQSLRTCIAHLKKYKNLTIKSTNKFSIISIVNWETYQQEKTATNKQTNKPLTNNQQHTRTKEHKKNIYTPVINHLNLKTGAKYLPATKKTQSLISARQQEGFVLEDFITVIDVKCSEWLNDSKMKKFLRPETLFGTKFESYLNGAKLISIKPSLLKRAF